MKAILILLSALLVPMFASAQTIVPVRECKARGIDVTHPVPVAKVVQNYNQSTRAVSFAFLDESGALLYEVPALAAPGANGQEYYLYKDDSYSEAIGTLLFGADFPGVRSYVPQVHEVILSDCVFYAHPQACQDQILGN